MSIAAPGTPFSLHKLGDIAKDLSVQTAVLDRFGVIVAVNEQWKRFGDVRGLALPEYGVGENYLRHCAFADPLSPRLIRGLSQVMSGEANRLSVVYSCDSEADEQQTWFLLLAFPHPESPDHIVVMHVDVTVLISILATYRRDAAADDTFGDHPADSSLPGSVPAAAGGAAQVLLGLMGEASEQRRPPQKQSPRHESRDSRHPPLSKRQIEVLALMSKGMTNAEIAHELSLSLNTVKVYVSGILARLGLQSRAQVLHWALTRRKDDADT
ncbi:MAG: LuxR C-terminal-related transcriptional regulator [Xanthobacteraceae bacterium]